MGWDPRVHEGSRRDTPGDAFRAVRDRIRAAFGGGPRGPSGSGPSEGGGRGAGAARLVGLLAVAALVLGVFTSYYQVEPDEVGVTTRFGRFAGTTGPGPHFQIPFGIERVRKVPVQRQLKMEFGFRTDASAGSGRASDVELR